MRLINRVAARVRLSAAAWLAMAAGAGSIGACAMLGEPRPMLLAAALTLAGVVCLAAEALEAGRFAYRAVEACAHELDLTPLGKPVRARRRAAHQIADAGSELAPE